MCDKSEGVSVLPEATVYLQYVTSKTDKTFA